VAPPVSGAGVRRPVPACRCPKAVGLKWAFLFAEKPRRSFHRATASAEGKALTPPGAATSLTAGLLHTSRGAAC